MRAAVDCLSGKHMVLMDGRLLGRKGMGSIRGSRSWTSPSAPKEWYFKTPLGKLRMKMLQDLEVAAEEAKQGK